MNVQKSDDASATFSLDKTNFFKGMQTYILLNAYKNLVNENAAGRNIARYFVLRNVDIADAVWISELQQDVYSMIQKIGDHGQTRLRYVCNMITQQQSNQFSKHNVWATCAMTGRTCTKLSR